VKNVVWTKNQCIYCEWAKNLLVENEMQFEERNINEQWSRDQMIEYLTERHDISPDKKITMPQIIIADHYVGGFTELKTHLK